MATVAGRYGRVYRRMSPPRPLYNNRDKRLLQAWQPIATKYRRWKYICPAGQESDELFARAGYSESLERSPINLPSGEVIDAEIILGGDGQYTAFARRFLPGKTSKGAGVREHVYQRGPSLPPLMTWLTSEIAGMKRRDGQPRVVRRYAKTTEQD